MTASQAAEPNIAAHAESVIATEVLLPGLVEPDGLQIRQRHAARAGGRPSSRPGRGHRSVVRRAGHAARPLPRSTEVPVRPRLRPGRNGDRGRVRRGHLACRHHGGRSYQDRRLGQPCHRCCCGSDRCARRARSGRGGNRGGQRHHGLSDAAPECPGAARPDDPGPWRQRRRWQHPGPVGSPRRNSGARHRGPAQPRCAPGARCRTDRLPPGCERAGPTAGPQRR